VVIDAQYLRILASAPTGAYPFGLALSPDHAQLYVTNTGLFEYHTIPGADHSAPLRSGLHFAPFGYPSQAAHKGTIAEGRHIPGLGDENSTRGSSLWTYDVRDPLHPSVTARLRLGDSIRREIVGGAAPTGVAVDDDAVFVSLAHQDAVVKISRDGTRMVAQTDLTPFDAARFHDSAWRPLRGVMPSGLAVRAHRLYAAESGINAVAVVDANSMKVIEHIPVGWNPSALDVSPDGRLLYVVNAKGRGTGPNGGDRHDPSQPSM
jgi:YVTN family beta-propeller protein